MQKNSPTIIVSGILFLITFAVNLEMPLFKAYADQAQSGVGMIGLAFASYIGGLLPTAILFGGLSDRIGRKPVLLLALTVSSLSVFLMVLFPNLGGLVVARVLTGIAVALGVSTGSSFLAELSGTDQDKKSAGLVVLTTTLGFGGGALATSIFLAFRQTLVPPTYPLALITSVLWLIWGFTLPGSVQDRKVPLIRLPLFPKGSLPLNFTIAVSWAVTGIVISIIPSQLSKFGLENWAGLSLFLINGTGALVLPLARRIPEGLCLKIAYFLLPAGFGMVVLGSLGGLLWVVLFGCAVAGAVCYGFAYFATLSAITQLDPENKARVVAGYLLFAYLGFGIPGMLLGFSAEKFGTEKSLTFWFFLTLLISLILFIRQLRREKKVVLNARGLKV